MNKVFLSGNIATDIELKQTKSGTPVATFNMAIPRDKGETDFLPVIVWNQQAENIKEFQTKGNKILLEGKIQTRSYDDKDGNKRHATEIVADRIEYLSKRDSFQQKDDIPTEKISARTETQEQFRYSESDLPF